MRNGSRKNLASFTMDPTPSFTAHYPTYVLNYHPHRPKSSVQ